MSQHAAARELGVPVAVVSRLAVAGQLTTDSRGCVPRQAIETIAKSRARGEKAWAAIDRAA